MGAGIYTSLHSLILLDACAGLADKRARLFSLLISNGYLHSLSVYRAILIEITVPESLSTLKDLVKIMGKGVRANLKFFI